MLRNLERKFKLLLSLLLRRILGSSSVLISPDQLFHRILVIRQHNQLGDMLCVVPLLRALREKYPQATISLMTSPVSYQVMVGNRYVNDVINFDKREFLGRGLRGIKSLFAFARYLRGRQFELVITPSTVSTSFTSDFLAYLSGAPSRIGVGSLNGEENPSGYWHNVPVDLDWRSTPHRHQSLRNLDVVQPLILHPENIELEITLDVDEVDRAKEFLRSRLYDFSKLIAYHPGAGKLANRWDSGKFAQVADELAKRWKASTLITSGPMDSEPVRQMTGSLHTPYSLVEGKPIREVAAILSLADLVISNDTGVMHVATAVGVPVLSLFGPTDPGQWAPSGTRNRYIKGEGNDINTITVADVIETANRILSEAR